VLKVAGADCAQKRTITFVGDLVDGEADPKAKEFRLGALRDLSQQAGGVLELLRDPRWDDGEPLV
jgi:hypothetical protein